MIRIICGRKFIYKIHYRSREGENRSYICDLPGLHPVSQNEKGQRNSVLNRTAAVVFDQSSRKSAGIIQCSVLLFLSELFFGRIPFIFTMNKTSAYPFVLEVREHKQGSG
jgi:hypothetical protein